MQSTLRLILGDQLNSNHSWFKTTDDNVLYVLMEIRSETDYATHHIQKIVGFFAAMRNFSAQLKAAGHQVLYLRLSDKENLQTFDKNLEAILMLYQIDHFEYQFPDEYRLDQLLKQFCKTLSISHKAVDSEHFYTTRNEMADFFKGKKMFLMESFYRAMRKKHQVLMHAEQPMVLDRQNKNELLERCHSTIVRIRLCAPHSTVDDYWKFCALGRHSPR